MHEPEVTERRLYMRAILAVKLWTYWTLPEEDPMIGDHSYPSMLLDLEGHLPIVNGKMKESTTAARYIWEMREHIWAAVALHSSFCELPYANDKIISMKDLNAQLQIVQRWVERSEQPEYWGDLPIDPIGLSQCHIVDDHNRINPSFLITRCGILPMRYLDAFRLEMDRLESRVKHYVKGLANMHAGAEQKHALESTQIACCYDLPHERYLLDYRLELNEMPDYSNSPQPI